MPASGTNNEGVKFLNSQFQSGGTDWGITDISDCVKIDTTGFLITFDTLSFVDCQIHFTANAQGSFSFNSIHMEEPDATSTQDLVVVTAGGAPQITWYSPNINVGAPGGTGPAEWATVGAGSMTVYSGKFTDFKTGTPPVLVTLASSGQARFYSTKEVYATGFSDYIVGGNVGNGQSWVEPNPQVAQFATPYTAKQDDKFLECNGGTAAVTLPTNTFPSEEFIITNIDSSASCVVTGNSGNINGAATWTILPGGTLSAFWRNIQWVPLYQALQLGTSVSSTLGWGANSRMASFADGRLSMLKNDENTGIQFDFGTDGFLNLLTRSGSNSSSLGVAGLFLGDGVKFTASGCSNGTLVGGAMSGSLLSGTTGSCTVAVTYGAGAFNINGSVCDVHDLTHPADTLTITAEGTAGFTFTGTTTSGDDIRFRCTGY